MSARTEQAKFNLEGEVDRLWGTLQNLLDAGHALVALREPDPKRYTLVASPRSPDTDDALLGLLNRSTTRDQIRVYLRGQRVVAGAVLRRSA